MSSANLESVVHADDLFDGLNPEDENPQDRKFEFRKNSKLEKLIKTFEENRDFPIYYEGYDYLLKRINFKCSAKDIEKFSIASSEFQDIFDFEAKIGVYLSALINKCEDKKISVTTKHLEKYPAFFGMHNKEKIITVNGSVDSNAGIRMSGGKLIILGNAVSCLGHSMSGGEILVPNKSSKVGVCAGMAMYRNTRICRLPCWQ